MRLGKNQACLRLLSILWLLFCAISLFAQNNREEKNKPPFPSLQLNRHVRGEEAIGVLGSRLPEVAAWYGKTTDELARLLRHDRTLWVSPTGRLFNVCELETPLAAGADAAAADSIRSQTVSYPLDQTFKLHSLTGSQRTIYLDFNGETVSGTAWNASFNGGATIVAAPFSLDGDRTTFSASELQMIQNVWKRVAEDYAPFDVDVTTEEPLPEALIRSSSSDTQYGNRVVITPTNFYPNAGGVSYVGTFNEVGEYYKTSWAFSNMLANGEKYIAEACSHENGHSAGLSHEGTTGGTVYYEGQGDWAPIMGNSYYKNVTQWAKGEYTGANNKEDQLQIMQNYGLSYYADDHGNAADSATLFAGSGAISAYGFIERNTDVDVFSFLAGAGPILLDIAPSPIGPDLKILAELRDGGGNLIASSSLSNLGASINTTVSAGLYYLSVSGIGSGDPASTGYSNYASLGQYFISGTFTNPGSLKPPIAVISASPVSGEAPLAAVFSASGSIDEDGSIASYSWNFGDGSAVSTDPNPSHSFTSAGSYKVVLTVTDNDGLMGSSSVTVTVTKDIYIDAISLYSSSTATTASASAAVTIRDQGGNPITGATVTGSWSGVVQGSSSGSTNSSGVASLNSPQSSASGTFNFTVAGVSASGYTYNAQLNRLTSASISANLLPQPPDTVSPTISIVSPKAGSVVSGILSVKVQAADNVGVKKVELYVDEKLTATSSAAPFTTKWNTKKASNGQHTLQTKAYDAAGNVGASSAVAVNR